MENQTINLGRVAYNPRGNWDSATEYKKLDTVFYIDTTYYAIQDNVGQTPSEDSKYWSIMVKGGGVTNAADEEDLTAVSENSTQVLKLGDRSYDPSNFSGKGYKILRKNIQQVSIASSTIVVSAIPTTDGDITFTINGIESAVTMEVATDTTTDIIASKIAIKLTETMTEYKVSVSASTITLTRKFGGTVTASSFSAASTGAACTITDSSKSERRNLITAAMINQSNTIYEIRYDFDLNGETLEVPEGCMLKFEGGCLKNGGIKGNKTGIIASIYQIFHKVEITGTYDIAVSYAEWFGAKGDKKTDDTQAIQQAINISNTLKLIQGRWYVVTDTLNFPLTGFSLSSDSAAYYESEQFVSTPGKPVIIFKPTTRKRFAYMHATSGSYGLIYFCGLHVENIGFDFGSANAEGFQFCQAIEGNEEIPDVKDWNLWTATDGDKRVRANNVVFDNCEFTGNWTNFAIIRIKTFSSKVRNCIFRAFKYANVSFGCDYLINENNRYNHCHCCALILNSGTYTVHHIDKGTCITNLVRSKDKASLIGVGSYGVELSFSDYNTEMYHCDVDEYTITINDDNSIDGFPDDLDYIAKLSCFVIEDELYGNIFFSIYKQDGKFYLEHPAAYMFSMKTDIKTKPIYCCGCFSENYVLNIVNMKLACNSDAGFYIFPKKDGNCSLANIVNMNCTYGSNFPYGNLIVAGNVSENNIYGGYPRIKVSNTALVKPVHPIIEDEPNVKRREYFEFANKYVSTSNFPPPKLGILKGDYGYETQVTNTRSLTTFDFMLESNVLYEISYILHNISDNTVYVAQNNILLHKNYTTSTLSVDFGTVQVPAKSYKKIKTYFCQEIPSDSVYLSYGSGYTTNINNIYVSNFVIKKANMISMNLNDSIKPKLNEAIKGIIAFNEKDQKYYYWTGTEFSLLMDVQIKRTGTTAERPSSVQIGFVYKDTTLNKLILWDGSAWVNMDGSSLDTATQSEEASENTTS